MSGECCTAEKLTSFGNPNSVRRFKRQITINIDIDTIEYFKTKAKECGIPYQTLINLYLSDCVTNERELHLAWK